MVALECTFPRVPGLSESVVALTQTRTDQHSVGLEMLMMAGHFHWERVAKENIRADPSSQRSQLEHGIPGGGRWR